MADERQVKALYPHPFPDFEFDPERWLGVSFGTGKIEGNPYDVPLMGFVFSDKEYAEKIHGLILAWTGGKHTDKEKCIRVAVIEDTESSYLFFCHPNFNHPEALAFYGKVEASFQRRGQTVEREATMLFLGRRCKIGRGSTYRWLRDRYRTGVPVMLEFSIADADGSLGEVEGARSIVVFDVLFAKPNDLDPDDPLVSILDSGPFKEVERHVK